MEDVWADSRNSVQHVWPRSIGREGSEEEGVNAGLVQSGVASWRQSWSGIMDVADKRKTVILGMGYKPRCGVCPTLPQSSWFSQNFLNQVRTQGPPWTSQTS